VVYHANYLVWVEIGRTEFLSCAGFSYRDMEEKMKTQFLSWLSYSRLKAPAYYDDDINRENHITDWRPSLAALWIRNCS